jgi:hypothetical protein
MTRRRVLSAKEVALTVCFSALYVIVSFLPISSLIGFVGKAITVATVLAPIIGMVLGSYLGGLSTLLGGGIAMFINPYFALPSLVAGAVTAFCAGLLFSRKRSACTFMYSALLFLFSFYPFIGPVWLYPTLLWFHVIGFLILISPIQSAALRTLHSRKNTVALLSLFITFLVSTLAGQIAGSLVFETSTWPIFVADLNAWRTTWQLLTFLYPAERTIIAVMAAFLAVPLLRTLRNNKPALKRQKTHVEPKSTSF